MPSNEEKQITKENLDAHLYMLAKEIKKSYRPKGTIEIVMVGGAAILANYAFRAATRDIDALMQEASIIKEAANRVADKFSLPMGWVNSDFVHTSSYSPNLVLYSRYYKTFCHCLNVRTVADEYLIAMKLESGRKYKNDRSDIVGILSEQKSKANPITLEKVKRAYSDLYGSWEQLEEQSKAFIEELFAEGLDQSNSDYQALRANEAKKKEALKRFDANYPGALNEDNIDDILAIVGFNDDTGSEEHVQEDQSSLLEILGEDEEELDL